MDDQQFVSIEMYQATVSVLLAQLQQATEMLGALCKVLTENKLVAPEVLADALQCAHNEERAQMVREAIAKLQGFAAIADMLKDLKGPIQ
jgi:hypothetical protein